MARIRKKILLFLTALLISGSAIKVLLGENNLLDKSIALVAVVVFFLDQITD